MLKKRFKIFIIFPHLPVSSTMSHNTHPTQFVHLTHHHINSHCHHTIFQNIWNFAHSNVIQYSSQPDAFSIQLQPFASLKIDLLSNCFIYLEKNINFITIQTDCQIDKFSNQQPKNCNRNWKLKKKKTLNVVTEINSRFDAFQLV